MTAPTPAIDVTSPLDLPFAALMTPAAALGLRDSLDVVKNHDMLALFGFLTLDREGMIAMIKSVATEDGGDQAMAVLDAISNVRDNIEEVARLAKMIEARAIVAMHVALGVTLKDTAPDLVEVAP